MLRLYAKRHLSTAAAIERTVIPATTQADDHFYRNRYLDNFNSKRATPLTLGQLMFYERHINTERLLKSANYVRNELPIRLAHCIREFQHLPYLIGTNPHIHKVYSLYWQSFEQLRKHPEIKTMQENLMFCKLLQYLLDRHLIVIPQLTQGVQECEQLNVMSNKQLNRFINNTLRSRISKRVIASHHLVLSNQRASVFKECSSSAIVNKCRVQLQDAHVIKIQGQDTRFTFVSDHVEYIIYQLLSNAFRHSNSIDVTLCSNEHDIMFRISDQGGGIDKDVELWSYTKPTCINKVKKFDENEKIGLRLGVGLPMSKVYAEYWGGSIRIVSMEGYGTDAYVKIPRLGARNENIASEFLDQALM